MKLKDVVVGKTGYTDGVGCDKYPHTVVEIGEPYTKRGRKPLNWIKGSMYLPLMVQHDEVLWNDKKPVNAIDGPCDAETGSNGVHRTCWFALSQQRHPEKIVAILLPDGELVCSGLGYRSYNRDSSF